MKVISLEDEEKYLVVMGRGPVKSTLAVCEIVSRMQNVPFRRDTLKKVIEAQLRRDKSVTLEFLGSLCELLGLTSQIGEVDFINIRSVESPQFSCWMKFLLSSKVSRKTLLFFLIQNLE